MNKALLQSAWPSLTACVWVFSTKCLEPSGVSTVLGGAPHCGNSIPSKLGFLNESKIRNWWWRCLIWSYTIHFSVGRWSHFGLLLQTSATGAEARICKGHDNATMKAERLKRLDIINSQSLNKGTEELCCDTRVKACMHRECISCKNKSLTHTEKTSGAEATWWYQWPTKKIAMKKKRPGKETLSLWLKPLSRGLRVARSPYWEILKYKWKTRCASIS